MSDREKVVIRFNNGSLLKGYLKDFSQDSHTLSFDELGGDSSCISVHELKAIFFVRTFEGDSIYREKKKYGPERREGRKIFIKFKDGESIIGYLQGDMPWDRGFFLSRPDEKKTGFFIFPTDNKSNNIKIYVVGLSVKDITALP
ncbi:MAG: hypothetical protein HY754_01120 [Nitrospirae bacterium]|nr:hypothetical protein [Nitrospirota bacterium]